jgi:DNA/RNA endonuclease YhcR with UshA esterase domain
MSYGFKFFNNNNETVIDDTGTKPWYFGQAQVLFFFDITYAYTDLNKIDGNGNPFTTFPAGDAPGVTKWNVYSVSFSTPAAYDCFVAFGLPNNNRPVYYAFVKPYSFAGDTFVSILIFVPDTIVASISDIPKAYIFVANPVPTANLSTGYGMHVFNASQQCTYDSNKKHFQPTDIPVIFVTDPTNYVYSQPGVIPLNDNLAVTFPTSAAAVLPHVEVVQVVVNDNTGTVNAITYQAIHRRVGSILRTGVPRVYTGDGGTNYTQSGFFNRGSVGVQPIVILDAAPLDQGYTPPEFPASYQLSISRTNIIEGFAGAPEIFPNSTAIITLTTAGVPNGTAVPYTITGISSADINNQPLTGNFIVSGNRATISITATADGLLEGIETATLTLNNGKAAIVFTISDLQSFALSVSRANPEEGQSVLVYLTTQSVPTGTQVPYTITGIQQADLTVGSLTGNFNVVAAGANGSASFQLTFARDSISETETAVVTLDGRGVAVAIPITDLSFGYNEVLSITPGTIQNNQNTVIQVTGGIPNDSFQWIVLPTGTNPVDSFNNRWASQYESFASSQVLYLDEAGNFYNQVSGPDFGGIGSWTLWIFTNTTKNFRSANVTVTAVPTFSLTASNGTKGPLYINEGQIGYFLVTTTNLPNGSVVYPLLVGPNTATSADIINSAANGLVINNNTGSFTIQMVADNTTESDPESNPSGQEFFNLVLDYPLGTRRDTYGMVYINDTSLTPASYSVSRSAASVNEGSSVTFTFTTNQSGTFYWTLTGMEIADIWYVEYWQDYGDGPFWANQGQINSGTIFPSGQVRVTFTNDQITEGAQTATFSVRSGSISGPVLASNSVVINDTSLFPAAGTNSGGEYCVGFDRYQNKHDGNGGTYAVLVQARSPSCGFNTWNESVSFVSDAWGDFIVPTSGYTTITIGQGEPNSTFRFAITTNSAAQPTTFPGTATLDGSGYFYNYLQAYNIIGTTPGATGDMRLWVRFDYNGNVRSARVNIVPDAGTLSGGQYCVGTTLRQNRHDGRGGTYAETVQNNSPTCGFVQQYYPFMNQSTYYNYNFDGVRNIWYINDAKPNSTVNFRIVAGPGYVGNNVNITTDGSGFGSFDIGAGPYIVGTYTINATFPGQDASYPANRRTLVFNWVVLNAYGNDPGGG